MHHGGRRFIDERDRGEIDLYIPLCIVNERDALLHK